MKWRLSEDAVQSVTLQTVLAANPMSSEDLRFNVHVRGLRPLRLAQRQ